MKIIIIATMLLSVSGITFADQRDHLNFSFQDHEHFSANQPAVGSADIDYLNSSFQSETNDRTGSQPEVGGVEIDYLNHSFQDVY